jgi:hypothetical protein
METTWTEAHVNQAKSAFYRLAADYAVQGDHVDAFSCVCAVGEQETTATRHGFVSTLGFVRRIDAARILRRVCARAEGREVVEVETRWMVAFMNDTGERVRAWPAALGGPQNDRAGALEVVRTSVDRGLKDARVLRRVITRRRITPAKNLGGS